MNNVKSLKSNSKIDSPKTPGGISKSLLSPCRRVGLSRNWRKSGPSPFVSPLANGTENKLEKEDDVPTKKDLRKRKERCDEDESKEELLSTPVLKGCYKDSNEESVTSINNDTDTTPSRVVSNPRRKKSKVLSSQLNIVAQLNDVDSPKPNICIENVEVAVKYQDLTKKDVERQSSDIVKVKTPGRTQSRGIVKSKLNVGPAKNIDTKENLISNVNHTEVNKVEENTLTEVKENGQQKSPENLTKECFVIIQKKLYKGDLEKLKQNSSNKESKSIGTPVSQALFDSDSDDVPLSVLNNQKDKPIPKLETFDEDDNFTDTKKINVKKLEDKTTSTGGLKCDFNKKKSKQKKEPFPHKSKNKTIESILPVSKLSSQSSLDDDEDFVMDNKRTILIKKTYEKVSKPLKAKSTGSITQKDIDELKARIEVKKKLLLSKACTEDTKELRDLIKKWQRGCQDALMELMELMKNKLPDKQNMDYSEILQTLKIPASLVGYDEENDCFNTPTDENIVLSKFNDT